MNQPTPDRRPVDRSAPSHRNASQRRESIIVVLRAEGILSIADLARQLDVSAMTIRRDLQQLEQTGQVRMVHGGASLSLPVMHGSGRWVNGDAADKARVGTRAATLIGETDVIAIDGGRLGYEVARALPEPFRGTVVTNSIPVIQLLVTRPRPPRVVGLGGEVMAETLAFVGAGTVAAIDRVRVGTLFLAAAAVDERGAYAHSDAEAAVKRALIDIAGRTVVIAGHDCFSDSAPLLLGGLDRIAALVTGQQPPTRVERALRQASVDLLVADGPTGGAPSHDGHRRPPGTVQPG